MICLPALFAIHCLAEARMIYVCMSSCSLCTREEKKSTGTISNTTPCAWMETCQSETGRSCEMLKWRHT